MRKGKEGAKGSIAFLWLVLVMMVSCLPDVNAVSFLFFSLSWKMDLHLGCLKEQATELDFFFFSYQFVHSERVCSPVLWG